MKLGVHVKAVGFAVTMATASMANASVTDFGTIAPGTTFSEHVSVARLGVFEDKYTFKLLTAGIADVTRTVTFTFNEGLGVALSGFTGLTRSLFTSANTEVLATSFNALNQQYFYTNLAAGDYYFKVAGTGWRANAFVDAPKYNGFVNITAAVPEPETYAMFLAGLGIVGTVIRRRSRSF